MTILLWEILFRLLVAVHLVLILANVAAIFILPFKSEWYVAAPLVSFLGNLIFNNAFKDCPLTRLESFIRGKIGKPPIKSFVGHYILRKIYRKTKK